MATARILAPWVGKEEKPALYHCVSRIVERRFYFKEQEKEQFLKIMRQYEAFCGVRVLSYCVMSNHFHLLLEVPARPAEGISDAELLERVALIYAPQSVEMLRMQLEALSGLGVTEEGRKAYVDLRERYFARMWDMGHFMKALKQRFSRWYNKREKRKGTLWEERYTSVLVEDGFAARATAAYIDLNPVRAGMVKDPKDYRWSNYAAAVAGDALARDGIGRVLERCDTEAQAREACQQAAEADRYQWRTIAGRYRLCLYEDARAPGDHQLAQATQGAKRNRRQGFTDEEVEKERDRAGELSLAEILSSKLRYFVDGAVIGSKGFVDGVIAQLNSNGHWEKPRKAKSVRWKQSQQHAELEQLSALRNLQRE